MAKFSDIFEDVTKQGTKIPTNLYLECGLYPIIDQGQSEIAGYTNETQGLFTDVPAIIFGDHTRIIKYIETPCFLGADGVKLLKAKDPHANYKYLYYALCHADIPNTGYNRHFKWLKEVDIREYTEQEQEHIVSQLERIDRLILLRKQQLSKLDELVKSRFIEMFGDLKTNPYKWECKNLLDVADIDTVMVSDYEKYADYPHIGIDSIEKNTGRLFGYRTVAEDGVISGKYLFTGKHIIYSKIRPNLNKVALPNFEGLCSADAYPILPKENMCLRIYLGYVMRSDFFLDYILPFSRRANMPKVNKEQLSGFVLPVPDIGSQNQFASFVEQTDKSKVEIQKSLEKLETLKKALMQKYFG